jgi:hypothetical protein
MPGTWQRISTRCGSTVVSCTAFSRRDLLAWLLVGPFAAAAARARSAPDTFRLLVHGRLTADAMRGLQFGVSESALTAGLMQRELQLGTSAPGIKGAIGVIAAAPPDPESVPSDAPIVQLREIAGDGPCVFRIGLSEPERQAALERWRAANADAAAARDPRIVEWHPALVRYGAKDLNDRYRKHTGEAMTADAWGAWFAVKALVDSALRAADTDLCRALAGARFDGHKGRPLTFDPATRLLRQPLYVVSGDDVIGEVM